MNRMTSDNTFEMDMHQLALNQVYIGPDGWPWYVDQPDQELSVCDLIRTAAETLSVELPVLSDEDLSDLLMDFLQYGAEEPEGVLAILYRALWAMAEVRARLFRYEDTGLEPEEIMQLAAPEPNDPLTLEGLREMDGGPVWVVFTPDADGERLAMWALVSVDGEDDEIFLLNSIGWSSAYEEVWSDVEAIYRHKPEEGTW